MKVEEVQRPCKRVAHRSGQNSSAAPATVATGTGTQGSITCFERQTTPVPSFSVSQPNSFAIAEIKPFVSHLLECTTLPMAIASEHNAALTSFPCCVHPPVPLIDALDTLVRAQCRFLFPRVCSIFFFPFLPCFLFLSYLIFFFFFPTNLSLTCVYVVVSTTCNSSICMGAGVCCFGSAL